MAFGKKQLILSALVLALGTAVYLNWQFSSGQDLIDENSIISTKELGEALFVNNTPSNEGDSDKKDEKKEEQPKNNTKADLKIRKEQKLEKEEPAVQEKAPAPNQRIKPMRKKQDDTTQPVKMDKR